jgi:hypothetical protein
MFVAGVSGVDWDAKLQAPDFHVLLFETLGSLMFIG